MSTACGPQAHQAPQEAAASSPNTVTPPEAAGTTGTAGTTGSRLVTACPSNVSAPCLILGEPAFTAVTSAAVSVNIPAAAAPSGEVFYAAVVANGNTTPTVVRRGVMGPVGAQVEFPATVPLPASAGSPATGYTVYTWSAHSGMKAIDLSPLFSSGTESEGADWSLLQNPNGDSVGVIAEADYAHMLDATAPFDAAAYQDASAFILTVDRIYPRGTASPGAYEQGPSGLSIVDSKGATVYNGLQPDALTSPPVLVAGERYLARVYTFLDVNGHPSDANTLKPIGEVSVTVQGDTQLFAGAIDNLSLFHAQ